MAQHVVGIDISDRSVEIVRLLSRKGAVVVTGAARGDIPAGTMKGGVVEDAPRLAAVIGGLLDDIFGPKRGRVRAGVSLPGTVVYSKLFSLPPNLAPALASKAMRIEAGEIMPIALDGAIDSYAIVRSDKGRQEAFYVAVDKETVEGYMDALSRAGVQAKFMDVESMAVARALLPKKEPEPVLIADIGAATTLLAVCELGGVMSSASIPLGGDALNEALERQLKITMAEAEAVKRKAGFDLEVDDGRVALILQAPIREIAQELTRTAEYHERTTGRPVRRIIITGGTSLVPHVIEYLSDNLPGHQVEGVTSLADATYGKGFDPGPFKAQAALYATAYGAALRCLGIRGEPGVDLAPRQRSPGGIGGALSSIASGLGSVTSLIARMAPRKSAQPKKPSKKKAAPKKAAEKAVVEEAEAAPAPTPSAPEVKAADAAKTVKPAPAEGAAKGAAPAPEAPAKEEAAEPAGGSADAGKDAPSDELFGEGGEHEFGRGVGELLGSVNAVGTSGVVFADSEEKHEESEDTALPKTGSGKISIESILQGKVADEEPPVEEDEEPAVEEDEDGSDDGEERRRGPVPALAAVLIVIVIIALAGIAMFVRKNGMPPMDFLPGLLGPRGEKPAEDAQEPLSAEPAVPASVSVNFLVSASQLQEAGAAVLLTRAIETDVPLSDRFPATGERPADDARATGVITIINRTANAYTFVATTRFLTPDGKLYRMRRTTPIPASGSVDVEVYADKTGPDYDIGPSDFTIPGLSADLQDDIVGKSEAPMSGGSGTVKAVTEEDIEAAKADLMERLKEEANKNFRVMAREGERILPDLVTATELAFSSDSVGTEGATFAASLELRFRALLVPEDGVTPLLRAALAEVLPEGEDPAAYDLGSVLYTAEAYDTVAEKATIRAEAPIRK